MKSAGNEGIVQSRLQVLPVHVLLVAPLGTRHVAQPRADQHQGGVAIGERPYHPRPAADLPVQPLDHKDNLHGTGVGHQDKLRALEHQEPGALGELPVVADHGPNFHFALGGAQCGDIEILTRRQIPLHIKVAGVDFGVGDFPPTESVK